MKVRRKDRRIFLWSAFIITAVLTLIAVILWNGPDHSGISRALAYKAAALSLTDRSGCEKAENVWFSQEEQGNWYVKYMNFLYQQDILSPEQVPATAEIAQGDITYLEVKQLAEAMGWELPSDIHVTKHTQNHAFPKNRWWLFFENQAAGREESGIKETNILLYGTSSNVDNALEWAAFTDQGDWRSEGNVLHDLIDRELKVLVKDKEIIYVKEIVSDRVLYRNAWLAPAADNETFLVYLGSIKRQMFSDMVAVKPETYLNQAADLQLNKGRLEKIYLKDKRIQGKVLSVNEDFIDVEGYGRLLLDENFKVYKVFGEIEQQKLSDILVGYDLQEFVVAEGKICAALTVREFDAKSIRVLLKTDDFKEMFHNSVTFHSESGGILSYGDKQVEVKPGEDVRIDRDDDRLREGRIVFRPNAADSIIIDSIKRTQGTPVYDGTLEIDLYENGIVLINELYLEEYLTHVVPSEMPASYEIEALKVQAVCARTYAYMQVKANALGKYGAHVDDSTSYQVYNNIETSARTDAAVSETYGKILTYQGDPVEAYYFSTSCGTTTDTGVWNSKAKTPPYLPSASLKPGREVLNLTNNEAFASFIKDKDYPSYDSEFPFYRWETTIDTSFLNQKIENIGAVLDLTIVERGPGGIARKLRIDGAEGSKTIEGEDQIRSILRNPKASIKRKTGDPVSGWPSLPSAYIHIEPHDINEHNITTFKIYGGGYGHGVGMSQNGAQGMAKQGHSFTDILKFFYPGTELTDI